MAYEQFKIKCTESVDGFWTKDKTYICETDDFKVFDVETDKGTMTTISNSYTSTPARFEDCFVFERDYGGAFGLDGMTYWTKEDIDDFMDCVKEKADFDVQYEEYYIDDNRRGLIPTEDILTVRFITDTENLESVQLIINHDQTATLNELKDAKASVLARKIEERNLEDLKSFLISCLQDDGWEEYVSLEEPTNHDEIRYELTHCFQFMTREDLLEIKAAVENKERQEDSERD